MAAGGFLHLWKEWGIQVMVLASLALQVFLLALGEIRRHSSSAMLSSALWLAYLSADSTAIYALGHLSVGSTSTSREHQLVAFWAPFLLLHLGGPDNMTAYSLEDNKLWLRHLQTLVVQVLGAAYVIYLYTTGSGSGSGTLLLLATISMFAVGLAKYGERTWALKCGNISSIAGTVDRSIKSFESLRQRASSDDEEDILLGAHFHFNICKGALTDVTMKRDNSVDSGSNRITDTRSVLAHLCRNLYKVVEMELSLMYDILYTKAAVIHTWYGFCIHSISLLGTSIGFLLFQLSINDSSRGDGNISISYRRADVVISYVLLAGALVVETISVCRAVLSTWTCSFLDRRGRGCKWLLHVITSLRRRVMQLASRRLWRGSIGQYGLLHRCSNDRNGIRSRLANKVGLQDWWNRLHFSGVFSGTDTLSMEELKMAVLGAITAIGTTGMNSRGSASLVEWTGLDEYYSLDWSVNIDLDKSILVWHIATNMHIRWASRYEDARLDKKLVEATKVLSNYMMFLLVVKPDMLPGRMRPEVYLNACKELDSCWRRCSEKLSPSTSTSGESLPRSDILADWLATLNEGLAKLDTVRGRTNEIFIPQPDEVGQGPPIKKVPEDAEDVYNAILLFRRLWYGRRDRALVLIFKVWVEMMLYVAEHCSRDSHARQLSNGGEFITIVWLAVKHLDYYSVLQEERRTMDRQEIIFASAPV